jgi:hypothetical protein
VAAQDPLGRLTSVAGAAVGAVGLVYVVGALSLSMRYEGFGLAGQQAAAVTPREALLAAGLRTLVIWVALGVAVAIALAARGRRIARAIEQRLRTPLGLAAIAALVIALLFARVLWPLAAVLAIVVTAYATVHWEAASWRRLLVTALSIGLVAVAYEADRITYYVEWTCVGLKDPGGRACGVLVGEQDRGFYLATAERPAAGRLLFVPASRVASASSRKQLARVTGSRARARRETIVSRVPDIRVR